MTGSTTAPASMPVVTLYGKPGCHLCDDARESLLAVRGDHPFHLEEVDISLDPVLFRKLGELIPVVAVDGEEAFRYHVDPGALRRLLSEGCPGGR